MKPKLSFNPSAALVHLRQCDPTLAALIKRFGPLTLKLTPLTSLFEAILRSIVYQQLHGKAAATIHARVMVALAPFGGVTPTALAKTTDAALRSAGLSRNKLRAIRDLAAQCQAGVVPSLSLARTLTDDELVTRLTSIHGVGPWTVHMLLIFYLGRPDVLPTGDFAIRLAFQKLYKKRQSPSPATISQQARLWQPYRSVASWYLWRSLDAQ